MNVIQQTEQYGTPQCREWRTAIFERFELFAEDLARGFLAIARTKGNAAGNQWLLKMTKHLIAGPWNVTHDDDALVNHAVAQARSLETMRAEISARLRHEPAFLRDCILEHASVQEIERRLNSGKEPVATETDTVRETLKRAIQRAREHCIEPPDPKTPKSAQLARLSCSLWWRRKLRTLSGRRIEQLEREIGRVHRRAGIYCSSLTLKRRSLQTARNRAMLEAIEAINQHGQSYTLAELSELGLANPDNRRAELMLRIRDTEAEARRLGHAGVFYTLTCPSRFHPVRAKSCTRNPVYDGASPRAAQRYLTKLWSRIRAKLARDNVGVYGIRVVEPHHDGTPHWHLLVWMDPENVEYVNGIMREYALMDSPDEMGAQRNRLKTVAIDPNKGSAAGYVAKYISKNINGQQHVDADNYGHDMKDSAPRIEAWAAVWGIRQFQFIGLPSVTVWREVRRLTEQQAAMLAKWEEATKPGVRIAEFMAKLRKACNAGQWDQFLRMMGGPLTPRKYQPVKPWNVEKFVEPGTDPISRATGEENVFARGRYGERVQICFGLLVKGAEYMTRFYKWTMRPKSRNDAYDFSQRGSYGGSGVGEANDPWTRVNNCTGPDLKPRQLSPQEKEAQEKRFKAWRTDPKTLAEIEAEELVQEEVREALLRAFQPSPPPQLEPCADEYFPI